jgi:hypothetical protein
MNTNFSILVDKLTKTKAAVSVVFSRQSHDSIFNNVDPTFKNLVIEFAKLFAINPKVKITVIADTSGSMQSNVPGIEEVNFLNQKIKLDPSFNCKREGVQIYTLTVLGIILQNIAKIMHQHGKMIELEYEIIPFDDVVRDILKLNVATCDNLTNTIIDHMTTKCAARGNTYTENAIKYVASKIDVSVPTVVIVTTDGAFNNMELVCVEMAKLMEKYPYITGGCIGMGDNISFEGVKMLNRGGCLIQGAFDVVGGSDNVIHILPCVLEDLVRLCSFGEREKNIPLFVKLTSKNGVLNTVFGDTLYPSKSYSKVFAVVETKEESDYLPSITLVDNLRNEYDVDLNSFPSNFTFGNLIDYVIHIRNMNLTNFEELNHTKNKIRECITKINSSKRYIKYIEDQISIQQKLSTLQNDTDTNTDADPDIPPQLATTLLPQDPYQTSSQPQLSALSANGGMLQNLYPTTSQSQLSAGLMLSPPQQNLYLPMSQLLPVPMFLEASTRFNSGLSNVYQSNESEQNTHSQVKKNNDYESSLENEKERFTVLEKEMNGLFAKRRSIFNIFIREINQKLRELSKISEKINQLDFNSIITSDNNAAAYGNTSYIDKEEIEVLIRLAKASVNLKKDEFESIVAKLISNNQHHYMYNYNTNSAQSGSSTMTSCSGLMSQTTGISITRSRDDDVNSTYYYKNGLSNDYEFGKCSICMENDACMASLTCGHLICCNDVDCVQYFELIKNGSHQCPFCRSALDETLPVVPITITQNNTKCQRCIKKKIKRNLGESLAISILECGHLGYCKKCQEEIDDTDPSISTKMYSCYECRLKKRIQCKVHV